MKDKNIVIAILAGSLIALAACGSVNQHAGNNAPAETTVEAKAETEAEPAAEQNVGMPNPWHETADLEEAEKDPAWTLTRPWRERFRKASIF